MIVYFVVFHNCDMNDFIDAARRTKGEYNFLISYPTLERFVKGKPRKTKLLRRIMKLTGFKKKRIRRKLDEAIST